MSSRPDHPTHTTGAHRARKKRPPFARPEEPQRAAGQPSPDQHRPPADSKRAAAATSYEAHLDGLFTYCLTVLRDHDTATHCVGEALALAERRRERGRGRAPGKGGPDRRPWLYALARWCCLRHAPDVAERPRSDARRAGEDRETGGAHRGGSPGDPSGTGGGRRRAEPSGAARRRELAALAWPETAGTTAEQREALELAVRHRLAADDVAAILRLEAGATRALLASAACEVERTRAALAVVEIGQCPIVARVAGDTRVLLTSALRRDLVSHVDDCLRCRRTAEQATAGGPWPGTAAVPADLPVLEAPRAAVYAVMARTLRSRASRSTLAPRFDRRGYPVEPKQPRERRGRVRRGVLTTTVVASVVAAPVLAVWAAYRGAPLIGEGEEPTPASAREAREQGGLDDRAYEEAGNAEDRSGQRPTESEAEARPGSGADGSRSGERSDRRSAEPDAEPSPEASEERARPDDTPPKQAPGRLEATSRGSGTGSTITLSVTGDSPVRWSLSDNAPWLTFSSTEGVLAPGQSTTVTVRVDDTQEPSGRWNAAVTVLPSGAVLTLTGEGAPEEPEPEPTPSEPEPEPSGSATA